MVAPRVVLASRSPQRRALLEALGVTFEVADPKVEESKEGDPRELVLDNARWKAAAVAAAEPIPGTLVIAGDTEVVLDGAALGQPESGRRRAPIWSGSPGGSTRCWARWRCWARRSARTSAR